MFQSLFGLRHEARAQCRLAAKNRQTTDYYFSLQKPSLIEPSSSVDFQSSETTTPGEPETDVKPTHEQASRYFGYKQRSARRSKPRKHQTQLTLPLSPVWTALPREIVDNVLYQAFHLHKYSNPTQVWSIRSPSPVNAMQIDRFFAQHWISRLKIRVCFSESQKAIYIRNPSRKLARRRVLPLILDYTTRDDTHREHFEIAKRLQKASEKEVPHNKKKLIKRVKHGYAVRSAFVPCLKLSYSGNSARCDWQRMLTTLFDREAMRQNGAARDTTIRWGNGRVEVDVVLFEGYSGTCYCMIGSWKYGSDSHVRATNCY